MPANSKSVHASFMPFIGNLYVFIFAMLLSGLLLNVPLIGGSMCLCGQIGVRYLSSRKEDRRIFLKRKYLILSTVLYAFLLVLNLALITITPLDAPVQNIWLLFAVILLLTLSDGLGLRMVRFMIRHRAKEFRFLLLYIIFQFVLGIAGLIVLLIVCPKQPLLTAAYLVALALQIYTQLRQRRMQNIPDAQAVRQAHETYLKGRSYRLFEIAFVLIVIAICVSSVLMYSMLALTADQLFYAMLIALGCNFVFAETANAFFTYRSHRKTNEPINIILIGLFLWLFGLVTYLNTIVGRQADISLVYLCMGLCSTGIAITTRCLNEMDHVMQRAVRLNAEDQSEHYGFFSADRGESAMMVGEMVSLLLLTLLFVLHRGQMQETDLLLVQFKPYLLMPAVLLIAAAILTMLKYPISVRYSRKLVRLLGLQSVGNQNPALLKQVEKAFLDKRKRPVGIHILMIILHPFFRHKMIGTENIVSDPDNPIVFLCNHGEFYGPITAVLNIPVFVRPWTISEIVADPQEFADYYGKYTLSHVRWIPEFLKPKVAYTLGRISVWGMDELESIPVYRNKPSMLRQTFRLSVEALQAGDNLLVFPEDPNAVCQDHGYERHGLGQLVSGFETIAPLYYNKTGKRLRFLPMFAHQENHVIRFGTLIEFNPDADSAAERDRITAEAYAQMNAMYEAEEALKASKGKKKD